MSEENDILDTNTNINQARPAAQITLPNSGGILAMGILSIVLAGLIGIILGIIALSLSGKALTEYNNNKDKYTEGSYKNANAGKICAIIGLSISVVAFFIILANFMN